MAKLFCIAQMIGGVPNIDLPYTGYVLADQLGNFGAYLISGSTQQLLDINALPQVVGIVAVTDNGNVRWTELDGVISSSVRTKINNFLTTRGLPNIPANWTYRQVITAVFQRFNTRFDLGGMDVIE